MELKRTSLLLLDAIKKNERGSYREWMDATGISSSAVIRHHLEILERAGKVKRRQGKARSVELVKGALQ